MLSGVSKSGSPAPSPMTSRPAAFSARALSVTAMVAEGLMRDSESLSSAMTVSEPCGAPLPRGARDFLLVRGGRGKTQSVIAASKRLMGDAPSASQTRVRAGARLPKARCQAVASPAEKAEIAGKYGIHRGGNSNGIGTEDKVALVTGASRGIGQGIAMSLAEEGCDLMLTGRDEARSRRSPRRSAKRAGRPRSRCSTCARKARRSRWSKPCESEFGRLDILVNNAGATKRGDFFKLTDADWQDGFALKFFAHVRLTREAWPLLKAQKGSLVTIAGIGGKEPEPPFTIGSSVNAACVAFTKALADIGKADGVQVNSINPGRVETERLWRRFRETMQATGRDEACGARRVSAGVQHQPVRHGARTRIVHRVPGVAARPLAARRDDRHRRRRSAIGVSTPLQRVSRAQAQP